MKSRILLSRWRVVSVKIIGTKIDFWEAVYQNRFYFSLL